MTETIRLPDSPAETPAEGARPILLAFNGVKGAGKDSAASAAKALIGRVPKPDDQVAWSVRRDGFADRLKLSAANALGHLTDDVDDAVAFCNSLKDPGVHVVVEHERAPSRHISDIAGREYLQYYGTEAHRDVFGQDFWIDVVLPNREVDALGRPKDFFFGRPFDPFQTNRNGLSWREILALPDLRFDNEAEAVHSVGGQVWLIQNDEAEKAVDDHPSEQPLMGENIDVVIDNNGTRRELIENIAEALVQQHGFDVPDFIGHDIVSEVFGG